VAVAGLTNQTLQPTLAVYRLEQTAASGGHVAVCLHRPVLLGAATCMHVVQETLPQQVSRAGEGQGLQVFPGSMPEVAQVRRLMMCP
jgi:hypothetical protein